MSSNRPAERIARIALDIESTGYAVVPEFLPVDVVAALRARADALDAADELSAAGVGRGGRRVVDAATRGDRIRWLDAHDDDAAEGVLRDALETLRLELNRVLALGLFEMEMHYALYPPGARYAPHVDRFRDDDARVLSCVLYLNERWSADDGGALRLQLEAREPLDILPEGGTLVAFLSARFVHEVLPARRARWSVTGWLRRRAAAGC
jgi:SM-20-related protein